MTEPWAVVFNAWILFWGAIILLAVLLGWARSVRKYWNGTTNREDKGDANE